MSIPRLEAEASGLLDRLLLVFQENSRLVCCLYVNITMAYTRSDPILIDATLNCMAILIRSRPAVANKIISAILGFNPLKLANSPMTPRLKVIAKSLERTTRALLKNINKNNPNGPLAPKIEAYLVRLGQSRAAVFADAQSLKRPAPSETSDGFGNKRARLDGAARYPPMPPPPNSYAQLFTLTEDDAFKHFDVQILNEEMVRTITHLTLCHLDPNALNEAIGAVRDRYAHLQKIQQPTPLPDIPMAGPTGVDDDDDYDPEYDPGDQPIDSPAVATAQTLHDLVQPDIALGPFELPKPAPLNETETAQLAKQTVDRVFGIATSLDSAQNAAARQKLGFNRLAASTNDRDAWVTMITRLATRATSGLTHLVIAESGADKEETSIKVESEPLQQDMDTPSLANGIRQTLYLYVLEDFRSRLNVAISWLNEEWYSDRLRNKGSPANSTSPESIYSIWTLRLLDALLPYLDARDNRLLIRFLSEIPTINADILERVKSLAKDPERVSMCIMALQYLVLMRPPVRDMVVDCVEGIWRGGEEFREANAQSRKVLAKWRPAALTEGVKEEGERELGGKASDVQVKKSVGMNGMVNGDAHVEKQTVAGGEGSVDPRKKGATDTPDG
jgi:symplekin